MSTPTFKTAVCRFCEHKWDLRKVYGLAELEANLNNGERLAVCPKCGHSGVSFPIHEGPAPEIAKVIVARRPDPEPEPEPEPLEETDVLLEPFQPEE